MFKPGSRIETKKDFIEKLTESGTLTSEKCSHLALINAVTPSSEGCEDCLKIGDRWVHLRRSNTEPVLRIITEAESENEARRLVDQVRAALVG